MVRALIVGLALALAAVALYAVRDRGDERPFDPYTDEYELSDEVRRRLWEIERRAFILTNDVCKQLGRALREGDVEEWEICFVEGVDVTVPDGPGRTGTHGDLVSYADWDPGAPARTVDVAAAVRWLVELRENYEPGGHVSVHFESMVPVDMADLDGAYDASWTVRLRGRMRDGGLGTTDVECALRFVRPPAGADTEWIAGWTTTDFRETRTPRALMEETTASSGIDTLALLDKWAATESDEELAGRSYASYFLDYDRDGHLDLLFCDRRLWLYRGLGDGRFEDVTDAAGLTALGPWDVRGGTVGDFDGDGDEDLLLLGVRGDDGTVLGFENLRGFFRPLPDGKLRHPPVRVQDGAVADFDRDGHVDVYYALSGRPLPEERVRMRWIGNRHQAEGVLVRNLGNWRFEDVTEKANALCDHRDIFAAAWTDLDGDLYPELVLAHHLGENVILHNRGDGTFRQEVVPAVGFGGYSMGLAVGDLDGDGDEDAYFANMGSFAGTRIIQNLRAEDYPPGVLPLVQGWVQGNVVLENEPGGLKESFEHYAGWAYGPAVFDLDGDGLLDLFSPAGFQTISRDKPDG